MDNMLNLICMVLNAVCVCLVGAMVETGYGSPKVAIFGSRGALLYESTGPKLCGGGSLKHIIDSLRVVQRESNEFLTSLVNEQSQQTSSTAVVDKDSADEEDDEDEDENCALPKKRKKD